MVSNLDSGSSKTTRIMSEVMPSSSPLSSNSSLCLHESRQNNRYTDKRSRYNFHKPYFVLRKYIFSSYNLSSSPDSFPIKAKTGITWSDSGSFLYVIKSDYFTSFAYFANSRSFWALAAKAASCCFTFVHAALNQVSVVSSSTYNCHQVVSVSVRILHCRQSRFSFVIVLSQNLSQSSWVSLSVTECQQHGHTDLVWCTSYPELR